MLELSKSIRAAWDEWTVLGLKLNMLRKELAEVAMLRDAQQEAFKEGKASAIELLEAQGKLYQAQIAYNRYEYKEIQARFYILDSVGSLLTHINAPPIEQDKTMEIGAKDTDLRATEALAEMDKIANPYPDYNFEFNVDLDDNMSLFKDPLVSNPKSPWYISAGYFDNKANAIALVNRLNALGFMASSIISKKGINVIVGPYDFPRQARTGMRRLQEMAHVQGVLMASK